ncbi:MAG: adenosine deaminase [Enterobacterales bacterium]|nr:adenosine deaminase [Enterobacterales bacterium]
MQAISELIKQLPKAELHLHIEGSLEPEMMFDLAQRNGLELAYKSVNEIKNAYQFTQLQDFLDIYYAGMSVLITEQDFFDLTWAYLNKCHEQNVQHVEIMFDPQGHTERGIAFKTAITGINRALQQAKTKWNISSKLIMCFLRHLSQQDAFKTLEQAKAHLDLIDAVGLDSSELGHPPSKFQAVFAEAKSLGLKLVAHAGEEGPPDYVEQALDLLKVDRIDHGNRAMESKTLIARLKSEQIALTLCPLSNLKLCVVDDLSNHPLPQMLENDLLVTINSDDPSYFGGYIIENFLAIQQSLDLTKSQIVELVKNGFKGSFLTEKEIEQFIKQVDTCANSLI